MARLLVAKATRPPFRDGRATPSELNDCTKLSSGFPETAMKLNQWMTLGLGIGLLVVIVAFATHRPLDAQDKKPRADGGNPFAGKIVMVYEQDDPSKAGVGFVLKEVAFVEIRGRQFLTGKCVEERGDALAGLNASIPLDNIGSIVEFENVDAYKQFATKITHGAQE
jgi:hypothetical protein